MHKLNLLHQLTCSGFQCRDGSLKSSRDIWGGTELTGFKVRAGGAGVRVAISRDKALEGAIAPLLSPPHLYPLAQRGAKSELSINLANAAHPTLVILRPNQQALPAHAASSDFSIGAAYLGLCCRLA